MATARRKPASRKSKARKAPSTKGATRRTAARTKTPTRPKKTAKARARAKPAKTKARAKPAAPQRGFFHIEVQPKEAFVEFKTQDIGDGGIERIAGKRAGGSWSTQEWLIAKDQAHIERGMLIGDTVDARRVLTMLGAEPRHIKADRFIIHGHTGMPADASPTLAPRYAGLTSARPPQKGRKWG